MKLGDIADSVQVNQVRRREKLPDDLDVKARAVYAILSKHLNQTVEKWLDGFCFDMNPDREIAMWEHYASVYAKWTKGKPAYHQAVCWRAILEDIANTPVQVMGEPLPETKSITCPFSGSAKTVFKRMVRELSKCATCNGTGRVQLPPAFPRFHPEDAMADCKDCKGTGRKSVGA